MKIFALIPARSGSVGVKDKNIRPLAGKPLMAYAIGAAVKSRYVDKVIVSTDSEKYAKIAREYGAETPFLRPKDLAEDVPTELVAQHAINWLEENHDYKADIVVTIQCTTPLLKTEDIDGCIEKLIKTDADAVITVKEVKEYPRWMFKIGKRGRLVPLMGEIKGEAGVRQTLEKLFIPNGAVYACKKATITEKKSMFGNDCRAVIMPEERSLDIDTELDFEIIEALIMNKKELRRDKQ